MTILSHDASSIHGDSGGQTPLKAYDNNFQTIFAPRDERNTADWVEFRFERQRISKVQIYNRIGCCPGLLYNTDVKVEDTTDATSFLCGNINPGTRTTVEEGGTPEMFEFNCWFNIGDKIKMYDRDVSARSTLSFSEIRIFTSKFKIGKQM